MVNGFIAYNLSSKLLLYKYLVLIIKRSEWAPCKDQLGKKIEKESTLNFFGDQFITIIQIRQENH